MINKQISREKGGKLAFFFCISFYFLVILTQFHKQRRSFLVRADLDA